ncbi:cell wall anchor protein [Weeksellaceae bacterium A-14]
MTKFVPLLLLSSLVSAQSWNLAGNSGTNSSTNFLGTTDYQPLILKSNNVEGLRILSNGNVRIGGNVDTTHDPAFRVYRESMPIVEIANSYGRFEIIKNSCKNCGAMGSVPGDAIIRNLGTSHNILFTMPNDNNDGGTFIGINDSYNGTWAKFYNNRTAKFNGKITAKEIEVKANVWADYVFKEGYPLNSLENVESYITEYGHLPNIPSAAEIQKNGINVAEMESKLLEKIEELTLYIIEQNKKVKRLEADLYLYKDQEKRLEVLESKIIELTTKSH